MAGKIAMCVILFLSMIVFEGCGSNDIRAPDSTITVQREYIGGYVGYYLVKAAVFNVTNDMYALYTTRMDGKVLLYTSPDPSILLGDSVVVEHYIRSGKDLNEAICYINNIAHRAYILW